MVSLSAYVRTSTDMMNRISYLDNDVMYTTWANVADQVNSGCEIVMKNSLFRSRLDLTTTVNLYNNHISAWNYDFNAESGHKIPLSGLKQTVLHGMRESWPMQGFHGRCRFKPQATTTLRCFPHKAPGKAAGA